MHLAYQLIYESTKCQETLQCERLISTSLSSCSQQNRRESQIQSKSHCISKRQQWNNSSHVSVEVSSCCLVGSFRKTNRLTWHHLALAFGMLLGAFESFWHIPVKQGFYQLQVSAKSCWIRTVPFDTSVRKTNLNLNIFMFQAAQDLSAASHAVSCRLLHWTHTSNIFPTSSDIGPSWWQLKAFFRLQGKIVCMLPSG